MDKVLSNRWLRSHKLTLPAEQLEAFEAQATRELEMRVGNCIAERLTAKQMDEFEKMYQDHAAGKDTDADMSAWLERECPNYRQIVLRETAKMRREILAASDKAALFAGWGDA